MLTLIPFVMIRGAHLPTLVVVGLTSFGSTTTATNLASTLLMERSFDVLAFHARGTGGRAAEQFVRNGQIHAMLDLTTTEVADEVVGGDFSAGPERLEAAGNAGIPQVILPGAIDMVNFGPPDTIPKRFAGRHFLRHTPTVTLMRTTEAENRLIADFVARKLTRATGPTGVVLPTRGFSAYDILGGPFFDEAADRAFIETLRSSLPPHVRVLELDAHINDPMVAKHSVELLSELIERQDNR
ncbi:Tm-1-like ATP-binding domain-containing protein [Bradyrhizobium iriomotense]|uniref:UPF0261 domain-containing protein n=1 Tax=Bradyrhizobium iriomotense TaxID=441950 RepID=A0ABQ6B2J8_9BRAD|nr:Tm-1-like ATP-binding domain-containing protein [Bradyrhizobium iriomotense]GLR87915.1 hypothetical protein GCM10007857_46270 [Bradyrhizobium iriomotense]